jgi:hypothetical protein
MAARPAHWTREHRRREAEELVQGFPLRRRYGLRRAVGWGFALSPAARRIGALFYVATNRPASRLCANVDTAPPPRRMAALRSNSGGGPAAPLRFHYSRSLMVQQASGTVPLRPFGLDAVQSNSC